MERKSFYSRMTQALSDFSIHNTHLIAFLKNFTLLNDYAFLSDNNNQSKNDIIISFYQILAKNTSKISPENALLIETVLNFNWQFFCDKKEPLQSYSNFLLHLISFNPHFLPEIFNKLACWLNNNNFSCKPTDASFFVEGAGHETVESEAQTPSPAVKRLQDDVPESLQSQISLAHEKIRDLLSQIVALLPMATQELLVALSNNFPFKSKSCYVLQCYVKNLLCVSEFVPALREPIISLLFRKISELDIDVTTRIDSVEDISIFTDLMKRLFNNFDDEISRFIRIHLLEDRKNEKLFILKEEKPPQAVDDEESVMKVKLDNVLSMLLDYFNLLRDNKTLLDKIFTSVLIAFDTEILPNNSQSTTQFAVFYFASFSNYCTEKFVRLLIDRVLDDTKPVKVRKNSARFLSSFVSHANFVQRFAALKAFDILVRFAHAVLDQYEPKNMIDEQETKYDIYSLFYSVCEAVFELFINRYELISSCAEFEHQLELLRTIISSKINPLHFCAKEKVCTFAIFAYAVKAVDCFPYLLCSYRFFRRNKSNQLSLLPPRLGYWLNKPDYRRNLNSAESREPSDPSCFPGKTFFTKEALNFYFARPPSAASFNRFSSLYSSGDDLKRKAKSLMNTVSDGLLENEGDEDEMASGLEDDMEDEVETDMDRDF